MIVCHCHAVTDRAIRKLARQGAQSPSEVALACGAGRGCGGCRFAVESILESETDAGAPLTVLAELSHAS